MSRGDHVIGERILKGVIMHEMEEMLTLCSLRQPGSPSSLAKAHIKRDAADMLAVAAKAFITAIIASKTVAPPLSLIVLAKMLTIGYVSSDIANCSKFPAEKSTAMSMAKPRTEFNTMESTIARGVVTVLFAISSHICMVKLDCNIDMIVKVVLREWHPQVLSRVSQAHQRDLGNTYPKMAPHFLAALQRKTVSGFAIRQR